VLDRTSTRALLLGVLTLAIVAAGCAGSSATSTPSPLSDPNEILARSLVNLGQAQTFHLGGTVSGSVDMSGLGALGGSSSLGLTGKLDLKGGTIDGDVDVAHQAGHVTLSFPTLFGLAVDLIQVDGYSYTKINLMSDKYSRSQTDVSAVGSAVPGPSGGIADVVAQVRGLLESSGATATLTGHSKVDGKDAYELALSIPADKLNVELASLVPGWPPNASLDSASATYMVYTDALLPAQLEVKASSPSLGNLDVAATLTRYDQAVTIKAPPADQVEGQ
jgi:hypothetical protein